MSKRGSAPIVRVLLVGGGSRDAEGVRAWLAKSASRSFDVTHVSHLAAADEVREAESADVVLLDVSELDRGSAGPAIRSAALWRPIPIVVLSDVDDEETALEALEMGARGYLLKRDLDTRRLVTSLETARESHRTILQLERARERALHLATHDQLTDLADRTSFKRRLSEAVAVARRRRGRLAVLFLNLDGLKRINETLGRGVGDRLLCDAAERLARGVRLSDAVSHSDEDSPATAISRLGGGEFTILLSQISDTQDAARVARRVLDVLTEPFAIDSHEVYVRPTVGISVFPFDGGDAETLLRNADTAMHQAHARGQNECQFFAKSMNEAATRRLHLETHLHRALERGQLSLHYQPVRHALNGTLIGAEALLRWSADEMGSVSPAEFIPVAEETGLIVPIGDWVLRAACLQCRAWQAAGFRPIRLAVNLSGRQIKPQTLVETVVATLEETGLSPAQLELEITESTLMSDDDVTIETLRELHDLGVGLALDDFGTGYSALSYLRRFPLDRVKIDRSFVREIATNPDDRAIAAAVIAMAHSLNLGVVAEGVETREQAEFLRECGCDELQGFLFSPAVPAEAFTRFLEREKHD